jgi:pimeloyl-ACP methyl ester carboxylesterase
MDAGEGAPAVVIVPALGDNVLGWLPVWRAVAAHTRACVYDRAGIGWSSRPPAGRRTFGGMADELHRALSAAGLAPPYLLVGHSLGGIIVRRFAARYPADVTGMVLVDSTHEALARHRDAAWRLGILWRVLRRWVRPLGLRRLAASAGLTPQLEADLAREVPAEHRDAARAITLSTRQRRVASRELLMMLRLYGQPPDLGSLPLTVLTAGDKDPNSDPVWMRLQADLAATSTHSSHVTADKAGHYVHLDDPELVIKTIRNLLEDVR